MTARTIWSAALVLMVVATACGIENRASQQPSTEPVTIGLLTPLSPPGDPVAGQLIQRGAELGVEYVNTVMKGVLGGRKVQLAVEDDKGTTDVGVGGYRRLVTEKKAVAVTGQFHSSVNLAVNEVANQVGVPVISTQGSAADITAKHYAPAFRTHVIDPIRASTWLDFIKSKGYKKVELIAETSDYGIGLVNETQKQATSLGLSTQFDVQMVDNKATDFTPQLLKAKSFGPDLLINITVGAPVDLLLDQASKIGLYPSVPMLVSYDSPTRAQWWQLHPQDGKGVSFIAYYSPHEQLSDAGKWLASKYQAKYNESPVYGSLNAFGDVITIAQALDKANSTDPKKLISALENGSFKGWATIPVTFPKDATGAFYHTWIPPILILTYTEANQPWQTAKLEATYTKK